MMASRAEDASAARRCLLQIRLVMHVEDAAVSSARPGSGRASRALGDAAQHLVTAPSLLRRLRLAGGAGDRGDRGSWQAGHMDRGEAVGDEALVASTQVSFEPPPWLELTTRSRAGWRPCQASAEPTPLPVVDGERPQVHMAGPKSRRYGWANSTLDHLLPRSILAGWRHAGPQLDQLLLLGPGGRDQNPCLPSRPPA